MATLAACRDDRTSPVDRSTPSGTLHQLGVDTPPVRQAHLGLMVVRSLGPEPMAELATLGERIVAATSSAPRDVTVTVGVGPRIVRATLGPTATGAHDLPTFAREDIADRSRGGDLLVQVCADGEDVVDEVLADLSLPDDGWHARGFRGEVEPGGAARNLLGFHDGVEVPTTPAELNASVWIGEDDPSGIAGSTIAVVRRMRIDAPTFEALPVARQERVIGRHRESGAPLSGGDLHSSVELRAKSDTGELDIPLDAHVRRAHPLTNGAEELMLRRSYSYDNGPADRGLLFVAFQRRLHTFIATQQHLDELDALMAYATTTASGTWLVPPQPSPGQPWGSVLQHT